MGIWRVILALFVLSVCLSLAVEVDDKDKARKQRKTRRKRRGCKCVHRYMASVENMMDAKLKEFKDVYLLPKLKETTDAETQRMRDALLRLSGDVAETKNVLRVMTSNMESMLEGLDDAKKDTTKLSRQLSRMGGAVANLTKYVDNMEQRLSKRHIGADMIPFANDMENGSAEPRPMPTQCQDVFEQGGMRFRGDYYIMIKPAGVTHAFKALCKMVNSSGWTVIQRRMDGTVDFFRGWDDYRRGFGTLEGEFWLGNDNIHYLTSQEDTMLRIEMEDWSGNKYYAVYNHFRVDSVKHKYKLHISGYHGDSGDSLASLFENHDGMYFSTKDHDNDLRYYDNCAQNFQGAWWFNNCFEAHLNGKYYHKGFHQNYFQRDGILWNSIHMYSSLKAVQMMIKPFNADSNQGPASNEVTSDV